VYDSSSTAGVKGSKVDTPGDGVAQERRNESEAETEDSSPAFPLLLRLGFTPPALTR
jgi:adenylate cyclase class IV